MEEEERRERSHGVSGGARGGGEGEGEEEGAGEGVSIEQWRKRRGGRGVME